MCGFRSEVINNIVSFYFLSLFYWFNEIILADLFRSLRVIHVLPSFYWLVQFFFTQTSSESIRSTMIKHNLSAWSINLLSTCCPPVTEGHNWHTDYLSGVLLLCEQHVLNNFVHQAFKLSCQKNPESLKICMCFSNQNSHQCIYFTEKSGVVFHVSCFQVFTLSS